jgi:peptidoglycan hydrolase CwlO-like protein
VSAAKTNVTNLQTQASGIISSVNGLDTRITAQGGDISTVNSTLSTQGSSISTLQSTVSNTIGNLASLTTRVDAGTQLNLLKNGGFENGLTDWTVVGAGWYANSGGWGQTALTFTDPGDGAYTYLQSDLIHVDANASYTATADNTLSFSGSAKARIEFRWFAANGTTNVGENYGTNKAVSRDFDTTGLNRRDLKLTSTAPSNAQYLRVSLVTQKDSGSFAATGWRQVKVERGTADTPYSAEASIVQSALALNTATQSLASLTTTVSTQGASITSTSQAVSTLQGSVSTLQSTVATQGSSITSLQTTISSAQGDLATLKTQVMAGGGNLLTNTDLAVDTAGWTFSTNNASVGGRNNPDANWYPSTENTLSIQQDNATATNTAEWTQYIELAGGKWYDVSVYAASLRAGIQIYLQCIDATGAVIATPTSGFIAAAGGGKTLADFPIRSFKTQVPATTVRGRLYLRKWGTLSGNSDSWAWFLRPQVTETLAGSSTPVAYSAGNSRASIVGQATALSTLTSNLATVQSTVSTQGGSISTLQSSMTNANGSISTLQSTVSTQGGSISTLQSSVTTVQGSVSTLQSTVSTQGASITSLQSTTSSLTGNVASLTTRVNASQSNLLANGGLENIFVGANYTSSFAWTNSAEWGPIATTTTNGTQTFEFADVTSVQIGATYWISCDPIAFGGSSVYCDLLFLNSSGSTILDGGQNPQAGQFNFSPDDTRRGQIAISAVAPANTSRIRARVVATVVGGAVAGFRRVKVETGPRWTPFSQEAAITSTWSAVNTATSSLATLTTRVGTAEGSITTIQSSLTSANGSISTLQTNVSSLQGSVSTLQSSSTTQAGQISTLQSTVSTQGASITSQGTAITTLQGSVSTLSNVVAASSNPNIISGFENGLSSWFGTSFTISSGPWGSTAYRNANFSGLLFLDSPAVPIFPGAAYTAAADSSLFTTGAGSTRVEILFKNSTGSVVGNPQSSSRYSSPNIDFTNDGSSRATLKASGVAPSGAVTAQVRLTASMTSGSLTSLAWRQPKLEQGGIATPYSGEASAAQTFQAYADLNTSYATLSTTVSSQGGSITTLQSSYTGLNGTVSSLQSTVASQGGSISTLQSTTSTLQGNVSSLTTRVSASQNNLAVNGGLENGYNTGVISAGTYVWNVSAEWGPTATTTVNGTQVFTFAEITNVQVGATYWVHCDAIAYGTSSIYCDLLFYNSSGTLLLDGGQNQQVGTFNFSANDGRRALIAISAVAPAGTTRIRPRVVAEVIGNQITGFRRFKVETGPTWSGFSTEASAVQQAQAITTATGQLSTLSTTVSTQGGFITTLQSSMTTVQGSVSTLQSTVSTQGATISTLQSTTSTLTGSVASLTTRVSAGSNVNMLKNGGFENGLAGWTPTGAGWGSSLGGWGATAATYSNPSDGEYYYLLSDVFAINPGATYTFTADNVMFKSANCWSRVEIIWVGSNGTTEVGHEYGTNKTVQRDYDNNGVNREEMKKTAAAPSNAYFARVSLVTRKDSGTMTVVGWRQAKFETGSVATPYSAEASIVQQYQTLATITGQYASLNSTVGTLNSSVSTQQTAINNLQGRTSAFWQVEAVAGGRAQLRVYADANGGAGVDIGGDLRINGNAMITGTLSVSALNYDMFVKKAHANVSGSPASGQTLMLYNQNMGQAGALGSYSLTVTASFQTNVGTVTSTMSGKPFYTNYLQDGNLIVRLVKNNNIVAEMSWQGDGLYPNSSAMRTVSLADRGKTVEVTDGVAGDLWLQVYAIRGNQDTGVQNGGDYYSRDVSANYQNFSVNAVGKWTFI